MVVWQRRKVVARALERVEPSSKPRVKSPLQPVQVLAAVASAGHVWKREPT